MFSPGAFDFLFGNEEAPVFARALPYLDPLSPTNMPTFLPSPSCPIITFASSAEVDDSDTLVAYRIKVNGRRRNSWFVYYQGHRIGEITKSDSQWVHDNWKHIVCVDHPFISRESRMVVEAELNRLRLAVMKAYRNRDSDVVVRS